jgi:hypothetical protein
MNITDVLFSEESMVVLDSFEESQMQEYGAYLMKNVDVAYSSDDFIGGKGVFNSCFILANAPNKFFRHTFYFEDTDICVHLEEIDADTLLDTISESKKRIERGETINLKDYDPKEKKDLQDVRKGKLHLCKGMLRKLSQTLTLRKRKGQE